MDPVSTMTVSDLTDHELLAGGVADAWAINLADARRWTRLVEFHRRREAAFAVHDRERQKLLLTARQETVVEVGELWGMAESWLRTQLNVALFRHEHLPGIWALCQAGQLDSYRARQIADTARTRLDTPAQYAAFDHVLTVFLRRHLKSVPGVVDDAGHPVPPLVTCTVAQLRNKLNYELRKLRPADAEDRHRKALAGRHVRSRDLEDGMGHLGITATLDQVRLAEHRLSLAARERRAAGDDRTLDQLRSDLALGLLTGTSTTADVPLPAYARPVINVTVPIQTLMGLSDEPGVLSGGTVLPAALTRAIAARPGATWHRMLTDPAGATQTPTPSTHSSTARCTGSTTTPTGTPPRSSTSSPRLSPEVPAGRCKVA